ncbi:PREDICTED: protein NRT1/ PTR FAMILY 3.1-like [Populus euphratica]|uniref:Protein NRT1/ PTR FAMILY 3.1-like n=1 Tax=Populus euphratica TaxID=75702 RepID=A0AAJ6V5Q9_POPEU|nr:PREDICTED: protein NRT1/ PTR FAMILY 3.1-like [Populus euphratica]
MEFQDNNRSHEAKKPEEMKIKEYDKRKKKLGGMKAIPFILVTEVCDRFSTIGFHANMITYLTQQLNLPLVKASNIVSNFNGTASLTPLIGALIADSFAGRFWTIVVGSIIYELGLISITTTTLLKSLHPPPCPSLMDCKEASSFQLSTLYLSLFLLAIGLGGTRPCVMTYAADQLDMSKSGVESRSWNFFNWYYFSLGLARLAAVTIVVYIQDNVSWGWGLGIPTIAMAVAFMVFLSGSPLYKKVKPGGSPLVRVIQVIVAAIRKRKAVAPEDPSLLYQNQELDAAISVHGRLLHTTQFKWLDKAAVENYGEATDSSTPNLWKLATVHRVEELKSFLRLLPVWAAGILLVTANSHSGSFNTQQARTMDRRLSNSFQIPPASMSFFGIMTVIIGLVLYERLFVPFVRRFTRNSAGITYLQRMGIGLLLNILFSVVAALVEKKRRTVAENHNLVDNPKATVPISVFWLVPQLSLHGMSEVFMAVGQLEFLYDQSPESMRSIALGLFWIASSVGDYLGTFMVSLIHEYTGHKNNWLPDRNLNIGKLDYYYWLVTGIQAVNFVYFVICAWCYTYKPLEGVMEEDSEAPEDGAERNGKIELTTAEKV